MPALLQIYRQSEIEYFENKTPFCYYWAMMPANLTKSRTCYNHALSFGRAFADFS